MRNLKVSTARTIAVFMTDSSDHISGKTGLGSGLTVQVGKNGAAKATITPTAVTEDADGWYLVGLSNVHTNTIGDLAFHVTGTGADPSDWVDQVVAFDFADAVRGGLTALPNANAEAAGGLYTRGTGAGQINQAANGQVDVNLVTGVGIVRRNTAAAGGGSTITLDGGASSTDSFYKNTFVMIIAGTGAGQIRGYSSYVGSTKVYTVDSAWTTNPDSTSVFVLIANPGVSVSGFSAGSITTTTFSSDAAFALFGVILIGGQTAGTFSRTIVELDHSPSSSLNDYYIGAILRVRSGTGAGGWAVVDRYDGSTKRLTLAGTGLPVAPDDASTYSIEAGPRYLTSDAIIEIIDGDAAIVEGSATLGDMIRFIASNVGGLVTDFRTGLLVFKSLDGTKTRATITTNASGRVSLVLGDLTP